MHLSSARTETGRRWRSGWWLGGFCLTLALAFLKSTFSASYRLTLKHCPSSSLSFVDSEICWLGDTGLSNHLASDYQLYICTTFTNRVYEPAMDHSMSAEDTKNSLIYAIIGSRLKAKASCSTQSSGSGSGVSSCNSSLRGDDTFENDYQRSRARRGSSESAPYCIERDSDHFPPLPSRTGPDTYHCYICDAKVYMPRKRDWQCVSK